MVEDVALVKDSLDAQEIYDACSRHPAVAALEAFNEHLASRPLSRRELRLFLASLAAFNRHTIGGIAILAGRLSDEVLPHLPKDGHEIGAYVLDAAVDEYGLRETVTHVELARNFAEHLGISSDEVENRDHACPTAIKLGEALFSWYRDCPGAFALGVHTASEVTSVKEFIAWHDVFIKFPQYGFTREMPAFEYMRAHCAHEPDHISNARICMGKYLSALPKQGQLLREGAETYLQSYEEMFHELDGLIFD
jgi:pyrroloquinoline quinone (PQQ) biosynthesis protein C